MSKLTDKTKVEVKEEKLNVWQKMNRVQVELKAPKNQWNKFGKYYYRSCEDILEGLRPLKEKYEFNVFLSDSAEKVGDRYYIVSEAEFVDCENGDSIKKYGRAREDEIKKGMDSSQITGSASSYARKYALNALFAIDDTKDSDATNDHEKAPTEAKNTTSTGMTNQHLNKLFELGVKKGHSQEKIRQRITKKYNKTAEELTLAEYNHVLQGYEKLPDKE